jgi:hypothetical protein
LSSQEAKTIVGLAESRLGVENCHTLVEPDEPMEENIKWFLLASENADLALIGNTDIHLQFETNAFERFYLALKVAMYVNGDWDGQESLQAAIERYLIDRNLNAPSEDTEKLSQHLKWGAEIEATKAGNPEITLEDVIGMKTLSSIYFALRAIEAVPFPPPPKEN